MYSDAQFSMALLILGAARLHFCQSDGCEVAFPWLLICSPLITTEAEHTIIRLPGLLYMVRSSSNAAFYSHSVGQSAEPSCFGMGLHITSLDMWQVCVFPHFWFFNNFPIQEAHGDFG